MSSYRLVSAFVSSITTADPTRSQATKAGRSLAPQVALCVALASSSLSFATDGWPSLEVRPTAPHPILQQEQYGLQLHWKRTLGSGYASIALAKGLAVTMFSDGSADYVIALDADTGKERWRHRIGDVFNGRQGSHDGPLSSPVIADNTVYALGPRGNLSALHLDSGRPVWRVSLSDKLGAGNPLYGIASTPIVSGKLLIVGVGGPEGRMLCALKRRSGERAWCSGTDQMTYQSATALDLLGVKHLGFVGSHEVLGVRPADGKVLWSLTHEREHNSDAALVQAIGSDRLLINYWNEAVLYKVAKQGETMKLEPAWTTKDLRSSYATPAYINGHIYGFNRGNLYCIDAESGARVWRSRPPGGSGFVPVGDKLIVLASGGDVVVVAADPSGYREEARGTALDGAGWTKPSVAGDTIYVRNLDEIAAVKLNAKPTTRETHTAAAADHEFGKWIEQVSAASDKSAQIATFVEQHPETPIHEEGWFHFYWTGQAEDVAIEGSMLDRPSAPMQRIPGTDFYHASYPIESNARWEYRFQIDFDQNTRDPRNPHNAPALWDDEGYSLAAAPSYVAPSHLEAPADRPRGTIETIEFEGKAKDKRELTVYLPPGYGETRKRYPLMLVELGKAWREKGKLVDTLDHMIGDSIQSLIAVFLGHPEGKLWDETTGLEVASYGTVLAEELIPFLDRRYRTQPQARSRALMGHYFFGESVLHHAASHADVFGNVALVSMYPGGMRSTLTELLGATPRPELRVWLGWSRYDEVRVDSGVSLRAANREMYEHLGQLGYSLHGGEAPEGSGWSSWQARTDEILEALFPL